MKNIKTTPLIKYFRSIKLLGISIILFVLPTIFFGCKTASKKRADYYLLVGTYTDQTSEGIYVYKFNTDSGTVQKVSVAKGVENPSYLAVSDNYQYVYSVNEMGGGKTGHISAFSFNREDGKLKFLNKQSSGGAAPCYLTLDHTGKYIFAANYGGGSFAMLPVDDGSLHSAKTIIQHKGGSVDQDRQQSPHVHCTYMAPDNQSVFVNDLGTDRVSQYSFDASNGKLIKTPIHQYNAEPGEGPRHITFHPNGDFAYLITEMGGDVVAFDFRSDSLKAIQTISALPNGYKNNFSGADIHVSPDGRFLYASLREDLNDIAIFKIDQTTGMLSLVSRQSTGGKHPRNFMIDPTGNYLLAANMNSDNIVVFKRDKSTGKLTPTDTEITLSRPVFLKMVPVN